MYISNQDLVSVCVIKALKKLYGISQIPDMH